ncbi:MAG: PP2C family protein-serine/threonine phosphatase [Dehalococcoidia bacterium]
MDIQAYVEFGSESHRGQVRPTNQDYAFAGPVPGAPGWGIILVADGVGGQGGGDWASQRAAAVLISRLHVLLADGSPAEALRAGFVSANEAIVAEGPSHGFANPATTMVAALLGDGGMWWANVGDSRLYVQRNGEVRQVSEDHSLVAERVRAGLMTPHQAKFSPERNVITRAVGGGPSVNVDVGGPLPAETGLTVLTCSDGLHGIIDVESLAPLFRDETPADAAKRAVDLANEAGTSDNVSIALGKVVTALPLAGPADWDEPAFVRPSGGGLWARLRRLAGRG